MAETNWLKERMKILITGICGFVGSVVAECLRERIEGVSITGIDNLKRPGSERNRSRLKAMGFQIFHGDIRSASDLAGIPKADWVIDAAADPSVLAGVASYASSRQVFEHNLESAANVLEYCKLHSAGLLLLSSSRVYSIQALAALPLRVEDRAYKLDCTRVLPPGISEHGIDVNFSTLSPISLYGATKLASEIMALEYGEAFGFPVWVTRCGVIAGAGQFGTADQGIFAFWINSHLRHRPMRYIGFEGSGYQTRDVFHPRDLASLLVSQIRTGTSPGGRRVYTAGGGQRNAMSLAQLTAWCNERFGAYEPAIDPRPRLYDIPWMVLDNREASADFGWELEIGIQAVLEEIALHAEQNPEWLEVSGQ